MVADRQKSGKRSLTRVTGKKNVQKVEVPLYRLIFCLSFFKGCCFPVDLRWHHNIFCVCLFEWRKICNRWLFILWFCVVFCFKMFQIIRALTSCLLNFLSFNQDQNIFHSTKQNRCSHPVCETTLLSTAASCIDFSQSVFQLVAFYFWALFTSLVTFNLKAYVTLSII